MLPVCSASAAPSSYSSQVFLHLSAKSVNPLRKALECAQVGLQTQATNHAHPMFVEMPDRVKSFDSSIFSPYPNQFDDIVRSFSNEFSGHEQEDSCFSERDMSVLHPVADGLAQAEKSESLLASSVSSPDGITELLAFPSSDLPAAIPAGTDQLPDVYKPLDQSSDVLINASSSGAVSASGIIASSGTIEINSKELSDTKASVEDIVSGLGESIDKAISKAENSVESTYNVLKSSVSDAIARVAESFDNAIDGLFSAANGYKHQTNSQLAGFSSSLKENAYGVGSVAIENLRGAIVTLEGAFGNAASFFIYSYGSTKSYLPQSIRDALDLSEEKAIQVARPVGDALQQVYVIVEGLEKNLGLDPTDPLVQFVLLVGGSATIGISYWLVKYGGYSGDLTPELTLELLKSDKNAVLIDVRPESLRERDGVPDLRRRVRSKYASVNLPEIDVSVRKLLKSGKDVNHALTAAVIRSLKIVEDDSMVIVMDANGGSSKAIARYLKRLGVKNSYILDGGFQSWAKSDLPIKELKPETTLTVLNEDVEAIIEEIKPTPASVIGYGLGAIAAIYALSEWEKTLQIIGIIGLSQTLYWRVASYEDGQDLKKDVKLLLAPVAMGARAFSWVATKMEPNKISLPTSPSSTAVRDRVVQAAAKHESQPSDAEEAPAPAPESLAQANENLDLSEA